MKSLFKILSLFLLLHCGAGKVNAQAILQVDNLFGFPDTAFGGITYPISVQVSNTGNAPYQGGIQIALQVDSSFDYLIFNSIPVLLLPGDSILLSNPAGFIFDSAIFKPGNNVVVVWPYVPSPASVDTFYTNVYFATGSISSISENRQGSVDIFPNPSPNLVYISSSDYRFEYVRIIDVNGRLVFRSAFQDDGRLSIAFLPSGVYILQLEEQGGRIIRRRLIRE